MTTLRNTELRLVKGTGSPSGRYAVAWGVPGIVNLDRITPQSGAEDRVRNFLVEKRTLNVVGTIPLHNRSTRQEHPGGMRLYKSAGRHWNGWNGSMLSHSRLSTYWDPAEQWAIILHSGKWWYEAIYLCHLQAGEFKIIEIGDQVEDLVRDYLLRTRRSAYLKAHRADERDPSVDVLCVKGVQPVKIDLPYITLEIATVVPKHLILGIPATGTELTATLELKIHQSRSIFSAWPVSLKVTG